jgi:hypothetical protein
MYQVAKQMRPGGRFFVTFNEARPDIELDRVFAAHKKAPFYSERNVYWYYRTDLEWAASFSPWQVRYIGDWGHPRNQRMVELTRLGPPHPGAARRAARLLPAPVKRQIRAWARRLAS